LLLRANTLALAKANLLEQVAIAAQIYCDNIVTRSSPLSRKIPEKFYTAVLVKQVAGM
jgi:hypothetical protein